MGSSPTISGLSSDALFCLNTTVDGGDRTSELWSFCPLARALAAPTLRCEGLPVGPPFPGLSGQQDSGWGEPWHFLGLIWPLKRIIQDEYAGVGLE